MVQQQNGGKSRSVSCSSCHCCATVRLMFFFEVSLLHDCLSTPLPWHFLNMRFNSKEDSDANMQGKSALASLIRAGNYPLVGTYM